MEKMTAVVRDNTSGEMLTITSEYATKDAFRKDLNSNGYTVIGRITVEGKKESAKERRYNKGCRA